MKNKTCILGTLFACALAVPSILVSASARADMEIQVSGSEPEGSLSNRAIEVFKEKAESLSGGTIKVKVFANHVLGTYDEALQQIRAGALTALYESIGVLGSYDPVAGIEGVSYLYTSPDEFKKVWDGPVGKELLDGVAKDSGFRMVGIGFGGFREMCLQKPVKTVDDVAGVKVRAPAIPAFIEALKALGMNPTPIAYEESYTAIQQGVVTGIEQPLSVIKDSHFYQVCKNLVLTHHMATVQGMIFSDSWYNGLDAKSRGVVDEAAKAAADWLTQQSVDGADQLVKDLQGLGMTVSNPDLSGFVKKSEGAAMDPKLAAWVKRIHSGN
jgi:tripartite ATP-independent transporter DctP family solute receptor